VIRFEKIETDIADKREFQIAAMDGKHIIGFVALKCINTRSAGICKLFVSDEFRQRGIGTKLVRECERMAKSCMCESINGYIEAENASVVPFYISCGWFVSCQYEDGSFAVCRRIDTDIDQFRNRAI
jgi:GNAT superfamily N-acetyltransferase